VVKTELLTQLKVTLSTYFNTLSPYPVSYPKNSFDPQMLAYIITIRNNDALTLFKQNQKLNFKQHEHL
jgi:hypothetical protein